MENFERGFTPPVRENGHLDEMFNKANNKGHLLDGIMSMMLSMETNPESRCELLIMKTGKEFTDKVSDLAGAAVKGTLSAEQKQEVLEYLTMVKGGLDTFIETLNLKSEE